MVPVIGCSVLGCGGKHHGKGLCGAHYQRKMHHGHLDLLVMRGVPAFYRIMAKVTVDEDGCWIVGGGLTGDGYAQVNVEGHRRRYAHVIVYENKHGPVPPGKQLDHLCRKRACCNPDCLEPVTGAVNVQRGLVPAMALERAKRQHQILRDMTHCKRGHEFTPENTYIPVGGWRNCRACIRLRRKAA